MRPLACLLFLLLLLPTVLAQTGKIPLLAVHMEDGVTGGSTAELTLEVVPGSGRVFVDTFPLTRVDTQMSMRLAKEVACDFLEKDCRDLDFIYTIRADSPIIGGPSAGAAAAVLTVATLSSVQLPQDIAMTGTINSGGLVGPVGGLKEKTEAAKAAGIRLVLVPRGEHLVNASNATLEEHAAALGIEVRMVDTIEDALNIMQPLRFHKEKQAIQISPSYQETMRGLAEQLCNRTATFQRTSFSLNVTNALNLSRQAAEHYAKEQYYAAASFCFGANVKFNEAFLASKKFSEQKYGGLFSELRREIDAFEQKMDAEDIQTITDLESFMVVKERLLEARESLNETTNASLPHAYAYANERLRSAYAWAQFLTHEGKQTDLDLQNLEATCRQKIGEAEERIQYLSVIGSVQSESAKESVQVAYRDLAAGDMALCLFRASKAKAEANVVLTALGLTLDDLPASVASKLDVAGKVISRAGSKGMFPILGYSYYEYAKTLSATDLPSAMLYAEYALELSNLDMYFRERNEPQIALTGSELLVVGVLAGFILGFCVSLKKR